MLQRAEKNWVVLVGQISPFEGKMIFTGWLLRKGLLPQIIHVYKTEKDM